MRSDLKLSLHSLIAGAFLLAVFLLTPKMGLADNWQANIHENGAPQALVGVDKKNRTFNFFEKRSPLSLRYQYPCVTGQLPGDKYQINDLKTPEGIYFVEYKIASGLDFKEYGGIAYTLNYPNPVDRLRGKTGYGIWIHSKGFGLAPTKGCVAINLQNIAEIGPKLTPGLPVIVAEELNGVSSFDDGVPAQLVSLMQGWTSAWESKSPLLFNYYNPSAYSKSTEDFSRFQQNKERLFKMLSFIKIYNREIHALEGPGYWVTWTEQLYTASNLSTEGVRRLYWQKDGNGKFRIVGMEWLPCNLGMTAEYKQGKLLAQASAQTVTDAGSEAPQAPRLDMPEQPAPVAEAPLAIPQPAPVPENPESTRPGKSLVDAVRSIADSLVAISEPLIPGRQAPKTPPDEIKWGSGRMLGEPRSEPPATPAPPEAIAPSTTRQMEAKPQEEAKTGPETQVAEEPRTDAPQDLSEQEMADLEKAASLWLEYVSARDLRIMDSYDKALYNRLPAASGVPRGASLNTVRQTWKQDFAWPGFQVVTREPFFEPQKDGMVKSAQDVLFITKQGQRQGVQNLWWQKDQAGEYKIVGSRFVPGVTGLEANYLELVTNDIAAAIEEWRKAWENASIDDYMAFYLPDAWQQGRSGAPTIRYQKAGLWSRVKPVLVNLSGLRLAIEPNGIRADMNQSYADSAGRSDKGVKTLFLRFDGKKWRIKREDWAALENRQE